MNCPRFVTLFYASVLTLLLASWQTDAQTTQCPARNLPSILSTGRWRSLPQKTIKSSKQQESGNSRIVGGAEVIPAEYPWAAYLDLKFWTGEAAICTGTLISDRWVMTAAHCFYGTTGGTVTLGARNISPGSAEPYKKVFDVNIRDVINHPAWFYGDVENDVALFPLSEAVPISDYIKPARLPYSDDPDQVGDSVTMIGWGNFSNVVDSGLSPVLRQADSTVIPYSSCQQVAGVGSFSNDKIICSDGTKGHRYCYGDDGGPLNNYRDEEQEWFAIGVAWLGDKTTECQSSGKPNLYARVSHYVDWIYNKTGIPPRPRPTTTTTTTTTTTPSTTTTEDPNVFSCKNKPNGLYPVPNVQCTKYFYYCANQVAYLYDCPIANTIFYYAICQCEFPNLVPGCADYVPEP